MSPRKDGALAKKKISLKLYSENGTLCLYIVERYSYFDPSAPPNSLAFFKTRNDAIDYLNMIMAMFSKIKRSDSQQPSMLSQFNHQYKQQRIKNEPAQLQIDTFSHYPHQCNEIFLRLPADSTKLFLLLGTLDNFLKHMHSHAIEDGYDISFEFDGEALKPENLVVSNRICKWLYTIIGRNSKLGSEFKQIYDLLAELRTIEGSLTPRIQEILFPNTDPFSIMRVSIRDPWALNILNPNTCIATKTRYVLEWLRYKLSKKSRNGCNRAWDAAIHKDIHEDFIKLKSFQDIAWNLMLDALHGKVADDGGFLDDSFYEMQLMRKATLELTDDFNFVLNFESFLETKAYKTLYKTAKDDVLSRELKHICRLMGLELEHNQNLHSGKARFNNAASLKLMQLGFHWSEPLAKKMLSKVSSITRSARVLSIVYTLFNKEGNNGKALPADLLPEILKMNEPTILDKTIKGMIGLR